MEINGIPSKDDYIAETREYLTEAQKMKLHLWFEQASRRQQSDRIVIDCLMGFSRNQMVIINDTAKKQGYDVATSTSQSNSGSKYVDTITIYLP